MDLRNDGEIEYLFCYQWYVLLVGISDDADYGHIAKVE